MTGRMTFYDNAGKILTALHPDPLILTWNNDLNELAAKSKEAERESDYLSSSEDEVPVNEE